MRTHPHSDSSTVSTDPSGRRPARGRALHVLIARHRRGLAALLLAAVVWLIASSSSPSPEAEVAVVAASRQLSGGARIEVSALKMVQMPRRLVPSGALTATSRATGQTLVADRPAGSVLTSADLLGSPRAGPGGALTGITISDPALLAMLQVGQTVSVVVAGDGSRTETLAPSAVVRTILTGSSSGALSTTADHSMVVVSTDPASAARIATHASSQEIGVVIT
ncbi:hypothetical protein FEZ32_01610 [Acidipropionibacterium jensenii]|uniref:SAF domain-containing protein n=1 Tax=Acidipropionibacterium jensenii TaxID=1749 RepID=UPI00110C090F|nr:SAF domain-containing protein [Acidipropionibacterium jensenii]QCV87225.1 hypothetical protein FEZ32_01610 [Acidipropionibacterium jensenii]